MSDQLAEKVYSFVRTIPRGKVVSYQQIARSIGRPGAARAIGSVLRRNPEPFYKTVKSGIRGRRQDSAVPCHRVVRSDRLVGSYSGGTKLKQELLKKEGVRIEGGRVHSGDFHTERAPEQVKTNWQHNQ